jgi:hypothetical protein
LKPIPNNDSRRTVMNRVAHDEAGRIAANIAELPAFIEATGTRG